MLWGQGTFPAFLSTLFLSLHWVVDEREPVTEGKLLSASLLVLVLLVLGEGSDFTVLILGGVTAGLKPHLALSRVGRPRFGRTGEADTTGALRDMCLLTQHM